VNITAAQQAANILEKELRLGGAQAAIANIDLLNAIVQAAVEAEKAKAAQPEKDEN
jgi:hypothetical protein